MKAGYVYIMANRQNGTIYIGVTSDLIGRVHAHREGLIPGFTKRYGCTLLVWYEAHDDLQDARQRELQMKEWRRKWKIRLIEESNLDWNDLYPALLGLPAQAGIQEPARASRNTLEPASPPGPRPSPGNSLALDQVIVEFE